MVLSPYEGEVPVGGRTPLEVHFHPEAVLRFDTRIKVRNTLMAPEHHGYCVCVCVCVCVSERAK